MDRTTLSASLQGRNNLQFPAALRTQIEQEAGLTDEEIDILRLRARGMSAVQISMTLGEWCSVRTVERRIRRIKDKIIAMLAE
nr:MAG TPA: response regulator [Caudoviricetes sp.]